MKARSRLAVGFVALACLFAACTSESADDEQSSNDTQSSNDDTAQSDGAAASDAVGVTDDTIKISLIASDLSALTEQNLAPEIGNAQVTMEAIVADINVNGGVAGRQLELIPHVIAGADAVLNPDLGRQACVQATEDDRPFAVIITAAITPETVQCAAVDHDALTITIDSWPDSFYETSEGRLFSLGSHISIRRQRVYRAWPKILDDIGELDGKTLGIIRSDGADQQESVDDGLVPALEDLGYEVAAEAVLPCIEGNPTCEQHDVAIQRMKDANVDFVFLVAQTLAGSATVEAAANLAFTPQWSTIGNNVTNTVARFFVNAKDNYDGAWGIDIAFPDVTDASDECNRIAVAGGAEEFPSGSDGYGYTAVTCLQVQTLVEAISAVDGAITQQAVIEAFEAMTTVPSAIGPAGSFGPDKHDAGNSVFVSRYDAAQEKWVPYDDATPIEVD